MLLHALLGSPPAAVDNIPIHSVGVLGDCVETALAGKACRSCSSISSARRGHSRARVFVMPYFSATPSARRPSASDILCPLLTHRCCRSFGHFHVALCRSDGAERERFMERDRVRRGRDGRRRRRLGRVVRRLRTRRPLFFASPAAARPLAASPPPSPGGGGGG